VIHTRPGGKGPLFIPGEEIVLARKSLVLLCLSLKRCPALHPQHLRDRQRFRKSSLGEKNMRSLTNCLLLTLLLMGPASFAGAQGTEPAGKPADSASGGATRQEVDQLRQEVAEQHQTIEQLKALVQQLVDAKTQQASTSAAQVVNATLVPPGVQATQPPNPDQKKPDEKKKEAGPPVVAGWNGEHFFIKSADGKFQIQPYGYVQTDYRAYSGDGAPPDTFVIRRARLGFQGSYGKHYDFALLMDGVPVQGVTLRDAYVNIKPLPEFQVQIGQYKVPFAREEVDSDANLIFIERSIASLLYPDVVGTFRAPGAMVWGNIAGGRMQYWAGAFNGRGLATNNTQNWPESMGRVRFYPWKQKRDNVSQGFAFGGTLYYGKSRGLSNETSFSGTLPDFAFTFFPSFPINGNVWRYEGEFDLYNGPMTLSGDYVQLQQQRQGIGSLQPNALNFTTLPGVSGKAGFLQASYLLTGEAAPENGTPKVKHPLFGPETAGAGGTGWGAFELAFRYDRIQAKASGVNQLSNPFTPGFVTTFNNHTDAFTFGFNWYMNYWVKYLVDFSVDRLQQVSINTGAVPQNYFVVLQRLQFRF
jgi:phosphate-selective porin OprO/OprP